MKSTRFPKTDVSIVIGSNDIVNPAAKRIEQPNRGYAGFGMLEIKAGVCFKTWSGTGYSGIENPLFYKENTRMFYGDAGQLEQTADNDRLRITVITETPAHRGGCFRLASLHADVLLRLVCARLTLDAFGAAYRLIDFLNWTAHVMITDHLRYKLANELHARPFPSFRAPGLLPTWR